MDYSKLIVSDGAVGLRDLKRYAPIGERLLAHAPLVFLNACQSAELSPYLYNGLVPYLIAKGARGVLGTEVNIPAYFAAEFAQALLARFLAGDQPLGVVLRDLRRHYLIEKHNVLGLIYSMYCSSDLVVRWKLPKNLFTGLGQDYGNEHNRPLWYTPLSVPTSVRRTTALTCSTLRPQDLKQSTLSRIVGAFLPNTGQMWNRRGLTATARDGSTGATGTSVPGSRYHARPA